MRRMVVAFGVGLGIAALALAQPATPADRAKEALARFPAERAEAAKTFSAPELAQADELAARAAASLAEGTPGTASRLARDARWALPFLPANLPPNVSRVLGTSRLRHADRINALAYSPDGMLLASASRDGTVRLWDLGNGRERLVYRGHPAPPADAVENTNVMRIPSVAFAPDGSAIASTGGKDIHIWDPKTGKLIKTLTGHTQGEIRGLAYGATADVLVSGSGDRRLILWDVAAGKPSVTYPELGQRVEAVAVQPKAKLIAVITTAGELIFFPLGGEKTAPLLTVPITDNGQAAYGLAFVGETSSVLTCGSDNKAKLTAGPNPDGTNPGSTAPVRTYTGHANKLNTLAASPDGKLLVTGGQDASVRVWDVATGKVLRAYQGHANGVTAVAVRPDGTEFASGGEDGSVRIWPLAASDDHRTIADATDALWTTVVSPDGKRLAAAGADRTIRVYDPITGKLERTLTGAKGAITALAFLNPTTLVSGSGDKLVRIWNLTTGEPLECPGHTSAILAVAADEAGRSFVSASVDKTVKGWDAATGKVQWTWTGKSAACAVAVRKDGRVAVGTADGWLTLLDPAGSNGPKVVAAVSAHGSGVASIAFHPEGNRLVTAGGDGIVRVWAISDEGGLLQVGRFEGTSRTGPNGSISPLSAVAYSRDGRWIVSAGADTIPRIWDATTGNESRSFRGPTDWVTAASFSPSGKSLVVAGVDKAIRIFELTQYDPASAAGHALPIRAVAISPDRQLLATGSEDRTVKIWDLATGKELATLTGATDYITTLAFAGPDRVTATSDDGKIRTWSIRPVKELRSLPSVGKPFSLALSADGQTATTVWARREEKGEKIVGFEIIPAAGEPKQIIDRGREVSCAALSTDATLGVTGGEDGNVRLWNLTTGERVGGDWPLFTKAVADLAISPDKKTLVGIDIEGTVKVADVAGRAAGEAIAAMPAGQVAGIVLAPTGDRFATLTTEGVVKVWSREGKEVRSWNLPVPATTAVFAADGKSLVTGNRDGTAYVLIVSE